VERGTGAAVRAVGKPIAGKTGTTNDFHDAWFVGFTPDLAAGVYIGYDEPDSLGDDETGGHIAAPVFRDFMDANINSVMITGSERLRRREVWLMRQTFCFAVISSELEIGPTTAKLAPSHQPLARYTLNRGESTPHLS
jgi:membrane peptidoglycan carboxypeptidase